MLALQARLAAPAPEPSEATATGELITSDRPQVITVYTELGPIHIMTGSEHKAFVLEKAALLSVEEKKTFVKLAPMRVGGGGVRKSADDFPKPKTVRLDWSAPDDYLEADSR